MDKKNKLLIATSLMTLLAVGGVTVGVTAALFTSQGKAKVHINAGNLNIGFYLTKLELDELTSQGLVTPTEIDLKTKYPDAYEEGIGVNLAKLNGDVITVERFYPTMIGEATFLVINNSDIAVNATLSYSVDGAFAPTEGSTSGSSMTPEETEQLDTSFVWLDSSFEPIEDEKVTIYADSEHNKQYAKLSFEFLSKDEDGSLDNKYQGCSFDIDTLLTATQIVRENSSN